MERDIGTINIADLAILVVGDMGFVAVAEDRCDSSGQEIYAT